MNLLIKGKHRARFVRFSIWGKKQRILHRISGENRSPVSLFQRVQARRKLSYLFDSAKKGLFVLCALFSQYVRHELATSREEGIIKAMETIKVSLYYEMIKQQPRGSKLSEGADLGYFSAKERDF